MHGMVWQAEATTALDKFEKFEHPIWEWGGGGEYVSLWNIPI